MAIMRMGVTYGETLATCNSTMDFDETFEILKVAVGRTVVGDSGVDEDGDTVVFAGKLIYFEAIKEIGRVVLTLDGPKKALLDPDDNGWTLEVLA